MSTYTLEQYAALVANMAKGVKRVRYALGNGEFNDVEYASVAEMRSLMLDMQLDLGLAEPRKPRFSRIRFDRNR